MKGKGHVFDVKSYIILYPFKYTVTMEKLEAKVAKVICIVLVDNTSFCTFYDGVFYLKYPSLFVTRYSTQ